MKKLFISSLLLIFSVGIYSQSKEECFSNLSIFAEYAKVKNYDDAYQPWLKVKAQCPDLNSAIYIYGERLLKNFIKKSEGDDKDKYQVDLLNLYSEWLKYFPKSKRGKNEIIFYDNITDLSEKIKFYKQNKKLRIKIARNGKKKYFELFNELKTTKYIIDKSLGNKTFSY